MNCRKSDYTLNKTVDLNFNGDITAHCFFTTILTEFDGQHARHQSQQKKEDGMTLIKYLS